ncbi:cutinase family protein [Nocardia sp. NPDC004068]|uniref:cutinase family protein n=1 Tax=Nocardia sp. NPDC004068 TaxID=3364303 RepID=UPI0036787BA2
MTRLRFLAAVATVLASCGAASCLPGHPGSAQPPVDSSVCPALWVLAVQGTSESSPTASPTADTGMVGALLGPVVAAVPGLAQRTYIAYPAGFGGAVGTGASSVPYTESVRAGLAALDATAGQVADQCPATGLAVVGYSQGAQVVSQFARAVGAGQGPVAPDRVAGVLVYSNPDRAPGAPVIVGRPGQLVPDPAPGTSGAAVSGVVISAAPAAGGGLAADAGADYGALTGRVVDICAEADVSCAAPDRAAVLRVGAEIAAQADLRDPVAALASLQGLLSRVLGDAWTRVVLDDIQIGAGGVDYVPAASLAQRLTTAADPRTPPPSAEEVAAATARWGQVTAAVAADPLTQLPRLAGQLSAAWGQFVADNADLLNPAVWLRYADVHGHHTGYAASGQLASGIAWLVALAHDLAGGSR